MLFPVINTKPVSAALRLNGQWLNWAKSLPPVPTAAAATIAPVWESPFDATAHLQACVPSADFSAFQETTIGDAIIPLADSIVLFVDSKPADVIAVPRKVLEPPPPPPPPLVIPPLISDGGFEGIQTGAGKYLYLPTGTPWTFTGNSGVTGNGSGFTWGNPSAPEGQQVAFLQTNGSVSQTVQGWPAGFYVLTFEAAQRAKGQASKQDFQVLIDGKVVGTFTPPDATYHLFCTSMFAVTAESHTITFQGLDTAKGDNTVFIDDVTQTLLR